MYNKHSLDEKFDMIRECRSSGLTDYSWCKQHGIPSSSFYNWIKQLKKTGAVLPEPLCREDYLPEEKQDVVKLEIVDKVPASPKPMPFYQPISAAPIEITAGKATIKISNDVNPALFAKLISSIGERL